MRLYDIAQDYLEVIEGGFIFNEETGELLFDSDNLDELKAELDQKLENCALYIKNLESDIKAISDEMEKLKQRRDQKKKKVEKLKDYVVMVMMMSDIKKLDTPRVALSTRKSSYVEVYDEQKLRQICPEAFVTQEPKLSKTELKKILTGSFGESLGEELSQCATIEENYNLQIK